MDILLGPGDAVTANALDLNSAVGTYATLTFDAPPGPYNARTRTVTLLLNISADSRTAVIDAVRAVDSMLNRATLGRRPSGATLPIVLSVRVDDTSEWVYFDVLRGQFGYPSRGLEIIYGLQVDLPLQLECLPYARGDAITDNAVVVTGDDPVFTRAAIPGDCPALVQYTITDGSGGSQFLNRIRIAHRAQDDLDDGDFDGYYNTDPVSPATDESDASCFGNDVATLDSANVVVNTWQDVGFITTPATFADAAGLYDIWARVDDSNGAIGPPTLTSMSWTSGGSLTVGANYQCCVTAIDGSGNESIASNIITINIPNSTNDAIVYTYTAPVTGTAASYRCYFKRSVNAWMYKTDAASPFTLTAESGATTADPPMGGVVGPARFRAQVSLESGTTRLTLPPVTAVLSNGAAEWLYLGTAHVPPMAVQEGGAALQGRVTIQTNSPTAVDILVDAVALLPADFQQVVASYGSLNEPSGLTLAALRKWVIGTDRHGRDYGRLMNTGDDTDEGQVSVLGPCYLGPGDTTVVVIPEVVGGVSDVANVSLSVVLRLIPRFRLLRGSA